MADVITAIGVPNACNERSAPFGTVEDPCTVVAQATGAGDRRTTTDVGTELAVADRDGQSHHADRRGSAGDLDNPFMLAALYSVVRHRRRQGHRPRPGASGEHAVPRPCRVSLRSGRRARVGGLMRAAEPRSSDVDERVVPQRRQGVVRPPGDLGVTERRGSAEAAGDSAVARGVEAHLLPRR